MQQYLDLLDHVMMRGSQKEDRTKTGTTSVFGYQMRFPLAEGFPLVTTKKLHLRSIIHELLWFLKGDTNIGYLKEHGVRIWDEWADENGDLGPVYGKQWRSWEGADGTTIDQIQQVIDTLRRDPWSRRMIVSAWNPADLPKMALSPCHALFQFACDELTVIQRFKLYDESCSVAYKSSDMWQADLAMLKDYVEAADLLNTNTGTGTVDDVMLKLERLTTFLGGNSVPRFRLHCQLYQRSADSFLGVPFNIASYALLTHMIAHVVNMVPGDFVHTFGDLHIYSNHYEQVRTQLTRDPRPLPKLHLNPAVRRLEDFKFEDITIEGYDPHPAIKAEVAV